MNINNKKIKPLSLCSSEPLNLKKRVLIIKKTLAPQNLSTSEPLKKKS